MASNLGIPNDLWGPMIIAIVSIVGIIVTMALNIKSQRAAKRAAEDSANAQFASVLNDLSREHSQLLREERIIPENDEEACELHALSYIDFLERVAILCINGKISSSIAEYFEEYFEYVQIMMKWYDEVIVSGTQLRPSKERWPHILEWCKGGDGRNPIPPDKDKSYLPKAMRGLWAKTKTE